MKFSIRRGLSLALAGEPAQRLSSANPVKSVGISGADFPGMRCDLLVAAGDRVAAGTPLFRDRRRPEILVTAPASGTVAEASMESGRRLGSLAISRDGAESETFRCPRFPDRDEAHRLLLRSGLWPSFVARPFGRIPDPGSAPDAIFVTAIDTHPLAADARVILSEQAESFARGVAFLPILTEGPVFVCQPPGARLVPEANRVRCAQFSGPHPAGLAGTHVDRLFPLHGGRRVWQIHYQDVVALGSLLRTGRLESGRVISLAGPGVRRPRLVRVPSGASLHDLVSGEMTEGAKRALSGPPLSGRTTRFLGRYHWQVTVLPEAQPRRRARWLASLSAPPRPPPVVPTEALEHALGPAIPVMPLVRALSIGDSEAAARLGCAGLLEEDVALLRYATGGDQDFPALLRSTLDILESAQ